MADDEEKKEQESEKEQKPKAESKKSAGFRLFTWLILGAVVIAGSAGGFALAQLLAGDGSDSPRQGEAEGTRADMTGENNTVNDMLVDKPKGEKLWPFDLEPVIANLDEPGVTRYARVTITLQLSPQMDQEKGVLFLEEKKPILRDWLTTYIAGLNLERVRGTRNLSRIKRELRDSFNELLFPEGKPFVHNILFKEFAIQ